MIIAVPVLRNAGPPKSPLRAVDSMHCKRRFGPKDSLLSDCIGTNAQNRCLESISDPVEVDEFASATVISSECGACLGVLHRLGEVKEPR